MWAKIKWLAKFYRPYLYVLGVLIILTPVQTFFQVTIPRLFGYALDYADNQTITDSWLAHQIQTITQDWGISVMAGYGLAFIVLGLISTLIYCFVQSHRAWMNCRLEFEFRQQAFDKITDKGPDFFNKYRTGDLVTRMTDDVAEKLSWFACSGIFRLYEAMLFVVFIVVMMLQIDPWLTLWTAGPLPILILVFFRSSSALDRRYEHLQGRISNFNDVMEACFSGIRVVKAYVRELAQFKKFDEAARERLKAEVDTIKLMALVDSLYMYIWQFALVVVLVAGGYRAINAQLSIGSLATFIYYVVYLVYPMFDIGQFLVKSRQSQVSIGRLMELELHPTMVKPSGIVPAQSATGGALRFEKVSFGFPDSPRQILSSVDVTVEPGETVALVGRVGSGKTWLTNLVPRLVDPGEGRITLDGLDIRGYEVSSLRRDIGYVPQEPVLFSDTVRNNVLLGREDIDEATINWALETAQLKGDVDRLADGMDTQIGTRGVSLSGGQKQRLALARALVGKPRILILDDCTSALDSRTEAALWDRLHEVIPDTTAIIITHRPDTLEQADRIYVLEDGAVAEQGTHGELMAEKTRYAKIYRRYQLQEAVSGK